LAWLFGGARVSADVSVDVPWGTKIRYDDERLCRGGSPRRRSEVPDSVRQHPALERGWSG